MSLKGVWFIYLCLYNKIFVSKYYRFIKKYCSFFFHMLKFYIYFLDSIFQLPLHFVKSVQIRSFFWSLFSCIRTEYGDLLRKSPYSVRVQKNTDQKNLLILTLHAVLIVKIHQIFFISNCTRFYKTIKQLQHWQVFGNCR